MVRSDLQTDQYAERLQVKLDGEGKRSGRCDETSDVADGTFVSRADIWTYSLEKRLRLLTERISRDDCNPRVGHCVLSFRQRLLHLAQRLLNSHGGTG